MISLEEYLDESRQYGSPRAPRHQGASKEEERANAEKSAINQKHTEGEWTFVPTIHASSQAFLRRGRLTAKDWKKIHANVIERIESFTRPIKTGYYVFYSKSYNQVYVVDLNADNKRIRIITVLPQGRSRPQDGTTRIMVEGIEIEDYEIVFVD